MGNIIRALINRCLVDQSSLQQHSPHLAYGVQRQGKLFLSHSGKDKEFVQFLHKELCSRYHYAITFSDAEAVSMENILEEARGNELGVLVLTNDFFVHTPNCMLELEAFVAGKVQLLPLFFGMSVSEFNEKRRRGLWERRWREWSAVDEEVIKKWRDALELVSTLNIGLEYDHMIATDVSDYVKKIVKEVTRIIPPAIISSSHDKVFGKDHLCEIVNNMYEKCASQHSSSIECTSSKQVASSSAKENSGYTLDVVGIYGFPGLGKTTLCKCLCDFYRAKFNGNVWYVNLGAPPSEQASSKKQSSFIICIMQHMLSMLTGHHYSKDDVQVLRKKLSSMIDPVFLAIDNILPDQRSQEEAKVYLTDVKFPTGSKIFITSRSKTILENVIGDSGSHSTVIEYMPALQLKEARDMFVHGFPELLESGNISNEEDELVKDCVNMCTIHRKEQYHPLMIKSLLTAIKRWNRTGNIDWRGKLAKLRSEGIVDKNEAWRRVFNMLDITFAKLSEEAKKIFLDLGRFYSTVAARNHDVSRYREWISTKRHLSNKKMDAIFRQLQDWGFFEEIKDGPRLDDLLVDFCIYKSSPGATGRAKQIKMPSAVKDLQSTESDAQSSIARESQLPTEGICVTSYSAPSIVSPTIECIDKAKHDDGMPLLLRLENTLTGIRIFVGIKKHAIASQMLEHAVSRSKILECYFFNAQDMAICVGVGLSKAKVILYDDLSITVEETGASETEFKLETWMPLLSDDSRHLVMKMKTKMEDGHVQAQKQEYSTLPQYGVSVKYGLPSYVKKYDETKLSWPLLYKMALFILTKNDPQCTETTAQSTASGSASGAGSKQNSVVKKLQGKWASMFNPGNSKGGRGDGDGRGDEDNVNVSEDDRPGLVKFQVTMYPQRKDDILDLPEKPDGLAEANIVPKLVFEFQKKGTYKRLSIQLQVQLEIDSTTDAVGDVFGWCHDDIKMSFGCEKIHGPKQPAQLEPGSTKILDESITSSKDTTTKSSTSTLGTTLAAGATASATFLGTGFQSSVSATDMQQEASNYGHATEMPRECICKGFSYQNSSAGARAKFSLVYPLGTLNIWGNNWRKNLHGIGLLSTISPHMQGVWMHLDDNTTSPYSLEVERSIKKLKKESAYISELTEVANHKQHYRVPFFVNNAMTHLRNETEDEVTGDQGCIPDVIEVGTANVP